MDRGQECFDGTRFEASIDEAFKRRIRFRVTFPFPEVGERKRLWRGMFPPGAVLESGIDWTALARSYEMSGGHIKNSAVRAAFLAAERGNDRTPSQPPHGAPPPTPTGGCCAPPRAPRWRGSCAATSPPRERRGG